MKKINIKPEGSIYSGHQLLIIPRDFNFIPTDPQISEAIESVKKEYPKNEIESEIYDEIQFVSSGQNFVEPQCNLCGKKIAAEFWGYKMDDSFKTNFQNLVFETECCYRETSLSDLIYGGKDGFATYCLRIIDADAGNETKINDLVIDLSITFRTEMRFLWRHI